MSAFGGIADIDCGRQSKRLPHSFARAAPAPERAIAAATLRLALRSTAPRAPRDRHYVVAALHLTRCKAK